MITKHLSYLVLPLALAVASANGQQQQQPLLPQPHAKRVAIIGAGAAGASTAYYLRNATLHAGIPLDITIYERNTYIGGRTTTVNAYDLPTEPVELGASIFVSVNHNLVDAVREFNLSTAEGLSSRRRRAIDYTLPEEESHVEEEDDDEDPDTLLGIWNGAHLLYTQPTSTPSTPLTKWYRSLRLLYHYGLAPLRTLRLVDSTVARFLRLYSAPHFPFADLTAAVKDIGLETTVGANGLQVLQEAGLDGKFGREIVQAATRVNYASDLDGIHGLGMLVSMATDGAMAVEGGNWQIFANMIEAAGANVRLNTSVQSVSREKHGGGEGYVVRSRQTLQHEEEHHSHTEYDDEAPSGAQQSSQQAWNTSWSSSSSTFWKATAETYDAVILAAPYHQANISFSPPPAHIPADETYRTLHVTLFSSPHPLSRRYFNLGPGDAVPSTILTTVPDFSEEKRGESEKRAGNSRDEQKKLPPFPLFYSISTLRTLRNPHTNAREYLYKVFSAQPFSNRNIASILEGVVLESCESCDSCDRGGSLKDRLKDGTENSLKYRLKHEDVGWLYCKTWLSYPILKPRVEFESIRLDGEDRGDDGLWYTSSIEGFISTMETSSLMGANVARLIVDGWLGESASESVASSSPLQPSSSHSRASSSHPQDGIKAVQDGIKTVQDGIKTAQDRVQTAQDEADKEAKLRSDIAWLETTIAQLAEDTAKLAEDTRQMAKDTREMADAAEERNTPKGQLKLRGKALAELWNTLRGSSMRGARALGIQY